VSHYALIEDELTKGASPITNPKNKKNMSTRRAAGRGWSMGCTIHGDAAITVTEGEVRVLLPPHLDNTVPPFVVIDPCLEHPRPDPLEVARSARVEHLHTAPPFTLVAGNKNVRERGEALILRTKMKEKGVCSILFTLVAHACVPDGEEERDKL
jgi:hypothetical protein